VVGKAPNGDLLEPFILKFVSDSTHLEEFIANDYKFSYFRGQMGIHKYTDYFQTGLGLKTEATGCTPTYDAFGDPIACDVVGFSSSGSSGGGATSIGVSSNGVSTTGGSGGSSGGSASCSWSVTYLPCLCEGRADGHSAEICGCGTGSPTVLTIYCPPAYKMPTANKTTSTINPCPDCPSGSEGGVGVSLSEKPPCPGNPVPNPEIAPQTNSGIDGGLHGTCTRTGTACNGVLGLRVHDGVDLKNPYGAPVYAMYDGTARLAIQTKNGKITGAGYHVSITSIVNGNTIRLVFFHLQENNRVSGEVKAGDIIGYQGDSGNLKDAIDQKLTISHVHIKARLNGQMVNPLNYLATTIDPSTGQVTKPCQ